jgi:hypothetical protein
MRNIKIAVRREGRLVGLPEQTKKGGGGQERERERTRPIYDVCSPVHLRSLGIIIVIPKVPALSAQKTTRNILRLYVFSHF